METCLQYQSVTTGRSLVISLNPSGYVIVIGVYLFLYGRNAFTLLLECNCPVTFQLLLQELQSVQDLISNQEISFDWESFEGEFQQVLQSFTKCRSKLGVYRFADGLQVRIA